MLKKNASVLGKSNKSKGNNKGGNQRILSGKEKKRENISPGRQYEGSFQPAQNE